MKNSLIKEELSALFYRDWSELTRTLEKLDKAEIDDVPFPKAEEKLVIFCLNQNAILLKGIFKSLGWNDIYFCDNDPVKQNRWLDDVFIVKPSELPDIGPCRVVVAALTATSRQEVIGQLTDLGLAGRLMPPDEVAAAAFFNSRIISRIYSRSLDKLHRAFSLLNDAQSKRVFLNYIKGRLIFTLSDQIFHHLAEGNQYYAPPAFQTNEKDVFVDAGAYCGDTIESFLYNGNGKFAKIYAFEPEEKFCRTLAENCSLLAERFGFDVANIKIFNAGLGGSDTAGPPLSFTPKPLFGKSPPPRLFQPSFPPIRLCFSQSRRKALLRPQPANSP